ncbi:hypothetical protein [Clostridium sp. FP1]|uniref:hypothetical protein n=1 Tax=Clostridium sp. FP1 TaxID=2724076 RepID=UPI0013E94722|nr:hypothetical protein [Clostridium sp. FP1]MBZ9633201.1 hypothetical protein [Clostridium sp. FP1]
MGSTNKTPNIGLNNWIGTDLIKRDDFNADNTIIDTKIKDNIDKITALNGTGAVKEKANLEYVNTKFSDMSSKVPHLGTTTNVGDIYNINTTEIINANQKFTIKFNTSSISTPALKMNNTSTPLLIKKANGSNAKLYASVYTLFFDGSNFILLGEGGDELSGNFIASDVLSGKTGYSDNSLVKLTGTMPNLKNTTLKVGGGSSIVSLVEDPNYLGIHSILKVFLQDLGYIDNSTQMQQRILNLTASNIKSGVQVGGTVGITGTFTDDATVTASELLGGKTAYVKGAKVTGTMPNNSGINTACVAVEGYSTPNRIYLNPVKGYYDGSGSTYYDDANFTSANIKANTKIFGLLGKASVVETSDANANADGIITGKSAYVNGVKVTGNIPNNGAINRTPTTSSQSIPTGYTTGGTIGAVVVPVDKVLAGTIIAGANGTMLNNGSQTATITTQGGTKVIPSGYTSGGTITASLASNTAISTTQTYGGQVTTIPAGYYASAGQVTNNISVASLGGKCYASGSAVNDSSGYITVAGLDFTPSFVTVDNTFWSEQQTASTYEFQSVTSVSNMNFRGQNGLFTCKVNSPAYTAKTVYWHAYGNK